MFAVCFVKLFVNFIWPGATLGRVLYMCYTCPTYLIQCCSKERQEEGRSGGGEGTQKHSCNHGSFHSLVEERMIVGLAQLDVGG